MWYIASNFKLHVTPSNSIFYTLKKVFTWPSSCGAPRTNFPLSNAWSICIVQWVQRFKTITESVKCTHQIIWEKRVARHLNSWWWGGGGKGFKDGTEKMVSIPSYMHHYRTVKPLDQLFGPSLSSATSPRV